MSISPVSVTTCQGDRTSSILAPCKGYIYYSKVLLLSPALGPTQSGLNGLRVCMKEDYSKHIKAVNARPLLSQVNVRHNFSVSGRNEGLPVTMTSNCCQILLYIQLCDR